MYIYICKYIYLYIYIGEDMSDMKEKLEYAINNQNNTQNELERTQNDLENKQNELDDIQTQIDNNKGAYIEFD
jgi:predicted nuclease with TOPRIM domain